MKGNEETHQKSETTLGCWSWGLSSGCGAFLADGELIQFLWKKWWYCWWYRGQPKSIPVWIIKILGLRNHFVVKKWFAKQFSSKASYVYTIIHLTCPKHVIKTMTWSFKRTLWSRVFSILTARPVAKPQPSWLVIGFNPSEKDLSSSIGMMTFPSHMGK